MIVDKDLQLKLITIALLARQYERQLQTQKRYRDKNREKRNAYCRQYRLENKEDTRAYNKQWYAENRELACALSRDWAKRNLSRLRANYHKRKEDPQFNIARVCRNRLICALKRRKLEKTTRTGELIGCSSEELRAHIEKQFTPEMNWETHGTFWVVDHIVPICDFDLTDLKQQKQAFHFSNLQPLLADDNQRKGCKSMDEWKALAE